MMMSLFSVFDPVSYVYQVNWLILMFPLLMLFGGVFLIKSMLIYCLSLLYNFMLKTFDLLGYPHGRGIILFISAAFMYICFENVLGLFPFIFTATAHPLITMGMGLIGWLACFMMGWSKSFVNSAAHLVPEGSPLVLSFLLVIIESISHIIRPFTLSIRLAANMMAGHLIIGLISSLSFLGLYGGLISVFLQSIMMVLESGVAVVQGLVFSILLLLYFVEYY